MHVHRAIQRHKGKAQSLLPVSSEGKKNKIRKYLWYIIRKKFAKFCLQPLLHKSLTPKQQSKNDISKKQSQKAETGEVERNYKMFVNPVVINPGRYIFLK